MCVQNARALLLPANNQITRENKSKQRLKVKFPSCPAGGLILVARVFDQRPRRLRVLRIIFAVPVTSLFWTEILDVIPGICWIHAPSLGSLHRLFRLSQGTLLPSPFTSSRAPLSVLDISPDSHGPFSSCCHHLV